MSEYTSILQREFPKIDHELLTYVVGVLTGSKCLLAPQPLMFLP